jgi:hypothetical protein
MPIGAFIQEQPSAPGSITAKLALPQEQLMKTILSTLVLLAVFSTTAIVAGAQPQPGPDQRQYSPGPQQYPPGPPDYRRGGDQIGANAQLSDLLRADYRIVAGYQGGLILVRNDRAFVCSYFQLREGGNFGGRFVSQGCNEVREPRNSR